MDLRALISLSVDAFDQSETPDFPLLVGNGEAGGNEQCIDPERLSHFPTFPTSKTDGLGSNDTDQKNSLFYRGIARDEFLFDGGKGGKGGKNPDQISQSTGYHFPPLSSLVGNGGKREGALAGDCDPAPEPHALPPFAGADEWRYRFSILNPFREPCPGWKGTWHRVHTAALAFLEARADEAFALGWTATDLFGVDRSSGAANVANCGALMLSGSTVIKIGRDVIRLQSSELSISQFIRPQAPVSASVPVWDFGNE